jgi:Cytochrome P460
LALAAGLALATSPERPPGYREWTHVKSMVITDKQHGLYGFHHVYANSKALPALKQGTAYPEGAGLVVTFYEVETDGGTISQGRKLKEVFMRRDATAKATGGWVYSAFGADGAPREIDAAKACHACHVAGAKDREFVFSRWVD